MQNQLYNYPAFQQVGPIPSAPVMFGYLSDQDPKQYEAQVAAILSIVKERMLRDHTINTQLAHEYEWILINELTKLKSVYTRYYFSVVRGKNTIDVTLYDPLDRIEKTHYSVSLDVNTIHYNDLITTIDQNTNGTGVVTTMLLEKLKEIPLYYLSTLLHKDLTSTCGIVGMFPNVFHSKEPIHPNKPYTMISVDIPKQLSNVGMLDRVFSEIAVFRLFPTAIRCIWKGEDRYTHALERMLRQAVHGDLAIPEELRGEDGLDYLTSVGVLNDKESGAFTSFFENMINLVREPELYIK